MFLVVKGRSLHIKNQMIKIPRSFWTRHFAQNIYGILCAVHSNLISECEKRTQMKFLSRSFFLCNLSIKSFPTSCEIFGTNFTPSSLQKPLKIFFPIQQTHKIIQTFCLPSRKFFDMGSFSWNLNFIAKIESTVEFQDWFFKLFWSQSRKKFSEVFNDLNCKVQLEKFLSELLTGEGLWSK